MAGDRISTDIRGARDFGMRSALLRTGEYETEDVSGEMVPEYIFDSNGGVASLFSQCSSTPHPHP